MRSPARLRRLPKRALLVVAALGLVASACSYGPQVKGQPWGNTAQAATGFYPGYANQNGFVAQENWLGHPMSYAVQFGDVRSASAMQNSVWGEFAQGGKFQTLSHRIDVAMSVPLAFGSFVDAHTAGGQATAAAQLQVTASGANDGSFLAVARTLRDAGYPTAVIRLGWEFDGGWMPWSSMGNEGLFIQTYRHVHDLFTSVSSGFRFDWNGTAGFLAPQFSAYPGDAYVDIIGLDVYDRGISVTSRLLPYLREQRDFALAHGKQLSYPEWGLAGGGTQGGNGDDPAFIRTMYDFMMSLADSRATLAYHAYFNEDVTDGLHRLANFPQSAALYQDLFGAYNPTATPPDPTRAGGVVAFHTSAPQQEHALVGTSWPEVTRHVEAPST